MRLGYKHYKPDYQKLNISSYENNIKKICEMFSNDQFISMEEISKKLNISKNNLVYGRPAKVIKKKKNY